MNVYFLCIIQPITIYHIYICIFNKAMKAIYSKRPSQDNNTSRAVPSFLQNKIIAQNEKIEHRVKKIANQSKQYQSYISTDETEQAALKKRTSLSIKNVPKVIQTSESSQALHVLIQCPKKLLVESLKLYRKSAQIQKVIEVVKTLFELVEFYGYFYCDNLMLKMSEDGLPVVWINSNFKVSYCQFPIRTSSVSELIFIKKLISTFSDLLIFGKNFEAETKAQLFNYLEQQKNKIKVLFEQFPSISIKKTNLKNPVLLKQRSTVTLPFNHQFSNKYSSVKLFKQFTPSKMSRNHNIANNKFNLTLSNNSVEGDRNREQDQDQSKDRKSEYKKRTRMTYNLSVNRRKTTTFQKYYTVTASKQISKRQISQKNDKKSITNFILDENLLKPSQNMKIQQMKRSNRKSQSKNNPNDDQNQTISQEFNFETEPICDNRRKLLLNKKASKQRKKSVDVNLIASWMKNEKPIEQPFPHSTFSTRVTFSSLKGELEKTIDNQSAQSRKIIEEKSDNIHIPHLYPAQKQKQAKEKLNADIKKIMKQSGMKIKQQDSFENEVENLLSNDPLHIPFSSKDRKISVKQSLLIEELQQLFQSRKQISINNEAELSFTKDFESVLELNE